MNVAILSGKGGTGKTTISTNLANVLRIGYVDSDVEEPNGFIFLNPLIQKEREVLVDYPEIKKEKCTLCGACQEVCEFHALAKAGSEVIVFEKLCHACGACGLICKTGALTFQKRSIGKIESGTAYGISCHRGILNVGEPMAVPVIKALLSKLSKKDHIIDCPPGTSCNVVNALRYADAAILVTEPSEFGFHDLKMALDLVKLYNIPYGVIINKDNQTENMVKTYCNNKKIPLLGTVPYRMEAAALYSKGMLLSEDASYRKLFEEIAIKIKEAFTW